MSNYFDNTPLVKVIYKWKWHIITITLVAAILGAVFSGSKFITPLFKSSAILYPSNITAYSDETCTEQMIQIMHHIEGIIAQMPLRLLMPPIHLNHITHALEGVEREADGQDEIHAGVDVQSPPYEAAI